MHEYIRNLTTETRGGQKGVLCVCMHVEHSIGRINQF